MFRSVRARMTLWNVGIVALTLTVFGLILRFSVERLLWNAMERDLRLRVDRIRAFRPPQPGPPGGPGMLPFPGDPGPRHPQPGGPGGPGFKNPGPPLPGDPRPGFGGPLNNPRDGRGLPPPGRPGPPHGGEPGPPRGELGGPPSLIGRDGRAFFGGDTPVFSQRGYETALRGQDVITDDVHNDIPVRVYSRPIQEEFAPDGTLRRVGHVVAVAQAADSTVETRRAIDGVTTALLLLMPVALILSGLGGAWLTEHALRPVRHLTYAASRMEANNLTERLPTSGDDEFSRLTDVLNGMLTRLETAFQRERRFTADASHELKTPLAIIKGNTSLALEDDDLPPDYLRTLRSIDGAADRANRIVQDLLLLAREGSGAQSLRRETVGVEALLQEAVEATGPRAKRVQVQPVAASVSGDRHHLTRLLVNLLTNALRHTPETGTVTLVAQADQRHVRLIVRDTGEGIAPEHLPHLTEPFYRVDSARTRDGGGSGLGLAIGESIARTHGGGLSIESAVGVGTTVTVTLPRVADGLAARRPANLATAPFPTAGRGQ